MLKVSDAYEFENKKITRNKLIMEIFELSEKILDYEIKAKEEIKKFYRTQKATLSTINNIEMLQANEYTIEREEQTKFLMEQIGAYKPPQYIVDLSKEADLHKATMEQKTAIVNQIQELIPKTGIATNYKVSFTDGKSCGESERLL